MSETVGPIKIKPRTKAMVELAAMLRRQTQASLVDDAVEWWLREHRDEVEAGLAHARAVLTPASPQ